MNSKKTLVVFGCIKLSFLTRPVFRNRQFGQTFLCHKKDVREDVTKDVTYMEMGVCRH